MANTLAKLQAKIDELGVEMEAMLQELVASGFEDDRPAERVPAKTKSLLGDLGTDPMTYETAATAPLPTGFETRYQKWYAACRTLVELNAAGRLAEFVGLYDPPPARHSDDPIPRGIKHWLKPQIRKAQQLDLMDGIRMQYAILAAVPAALQARMLDVELTVLAELGDDEIAAARHLQKSGFLRAAGAVAGVVLEAHLKMLLDKHSPPVKRPASAMLGKLNELCKASDVYDQPTWRKVQYLADLRNKCDHKGTDEPADEEITELIDGVVALTHKVIPGYTP